MKQDPPFAFGANCRVKIKRLTVRRLEIPVRRFGGSKMWGASREGEACQLSWYLDSLIGLWRSCQPRTYLPKYLPRYLYNITYQVQGR